MTFIVWGAIHGGFLCLERVVRERWRVLYPEPVLPAAASLFLRWLLTFHVVCLAWIFFRADSVGTAFEVLGGLVSGSGPSPLVTPLADRKSVVSGTRVSVRVNLGGSRLIKTNKK